MSKVPVPGPLGLKLSQPLEWYETVSKLSASDARVFTTLNSSTSSEPSRWRAARFKASRARKRPVQGKTTANEQRSGPWRKTTVNEQQLEPTRQTPASHCQESCQPLSGILRGFRLRLLVAFGDSSGPNGATCFRGFQWPHAERDIALMARCHFHCLWRHIVFRSY